MEADGDEKFGATEDVQYQEWCRVQYQMAHHDVWWPKAQQMNAANLTLLLLAAVIGVSKLIWPTHNATNDDRWLLTVLAGITVGLGIAYAWNLYYTMVRARGRAEKIVKRIDDEFKLLEGALEDPKRNRVFPQIITGMHLIAYSVALAFFWTAL